MFLSFKALYITGGKPSVCNKFTYQKLYFAFPMNSRKTRLCNTFYISMAKLSYGALEVSSDLLRSWDNLSQDDDILKVVKSCSRDNLSRDGDILKIGCCRLTTFRMSCSRDNLSRDVDILKVGCRHPEINYLGMTTSYFHNIDIDIHILLLGCRHTKINYVGMSSSYVDDVIIQR